LRRPNNFLWGGIHEGGNIEEEDEEEGGMIMKYYSLVRVIDPRPPRERWR